MKVAYNSPVILTFGLIASMVWGTNEYIGGGLRDFYFTAYPHFDFKSTIDYLRLFSYIFGHENWEHLAHNFLVILLLGPLVETIYGSGKLLLMVLVTAVVTSAMNILFFSTGLMGASGIVFMLVIVGSFAGSKNDEIPLTFILVAALIFGNQIFEALGQDDISQFAHIIGGICGSGFGFFLKKA